MPPSPQHASIPSQPDYPSEFRSRPHIEEYHDSLDASRNQMPESGGRRNSYTEIMEQRHEQASIDKARRRKRRREVHKTWDAEVVHRFQTITSSVYQDGKLQLYDHALEIGPWGFADKEKEYRYRKEFDLTFVANNKLLLAYIFYYSLAFDAWMIVFQGNQQSMLSICFTLPMAIMLTHPRVSQRTKQVFNVIKFIYRNLGRWILLADYLQPTTTIQKHMILSTFLGILIDPWFSQSWPLSLCNHFLLWVPILDTVALRPHLHPERHEHLIPWTLAMMSIGVLGPAWSYCFHMHRRQVWNQLRRRRRQGSQSYTRLRTRPREENPGGLEELTESDAESMDEDNN